MHLYLVRHGQTEANRLGLFNGRNEKDLTEIGVQQVEELVPEVAALPIDLIVSSPLKRAVHTAQILNTKNLPCFTDERLIERDSGKMMYQPENLIPDKTALYQPGNHDEIKEFEPFEAVCDRVKDFLEDVKTKYPDKNILVVTHGDVIVAFQVYIEKKRKEEYPKTGGLLRI